MATSNPTGRRKWIPFSRKDSGGDQSSQDEKSGSGPARWSMGVLNDKKTVEVPGSVLLLASNRNEPLGLRNAPARTSHSSIPTGYLPEPPQTARQQQQQQEGEEEEEEEEEAAKKKTSDGKIILVPQPEESANDPLNWPAWRRDAALMSLGLYCMVGGGLTPILAAGFTNVADDYHINVSKVSLTTGLYMTGLGLGSVIFSPTAILFGKRPVYLFSTIILILTSVWCALSPSFPSLIVARIFQGIAVSPVECLPSATIAEIFFLHERAFRIGIYTLLLLGGKNLVPLVSAAVIQRLSWRWVFWMVAFVVAFCGSLLFFFVPETFWDRTPVPKSPKHASRPAFFRRFSSRQNIPRVPPAAAAPADTEPIGAEATSPEVQTDAPFPGLAHRRHKNVHVGFAPASEPEKSPADAAADTADEEKAVGPAPAATSPEMAEHRPASPARSHRVGFALDAGPPTSERDPEDRHLHAPGHVPPGVDGSDENHSHPTQAFGLRQVPHIDSHGHSPAHSPLATPRDNPLAMSSSPARHLASGRPTGDADGEGQSISIRSTSVSSIPPGGGAYTHALRDQPARSFVQQLKPFHGRLNKDKWLKVAVRPFILFSYPAVLWSAAVYACSVGWLIVLSESVSVIYRDADTYNFTALQTGLVYVSPFVGGILGTAVAGRVSDVVVMAMARRNGGLYEPEFRLVMAAPVALTTAIGLMGFGWSAQVRDSWIVPTVFFGLVSFGCSLGSTTSITFCVDSYRQYAGEALVTLNFSKNILHGLVFSLFVTAWIDDDGPKTVFTWLGIMQLIVLVFTIPMYLFGKRARMWTVRKNFMEKF